MKLRCKQFSDWFTQNVSISEMGYLFYHVWPVYGIGLRISFSKQYRYVTNHLHPYVTNDYIFVCIYHLTAYCVPCSCHCQYFLKYNIYNSYNICPNQHTSYGPIFNIQCLILQTCACAIRIRIWIIYLYSAYYKLTRSFLVHFYIKQNK